MQAAPACTSSATSTTPSTRVTAIPRSLPESSTTPWHRVTPFLSTNTAAAPYCSSTDINDNAPGFTSGATATTPENVATTTPVYTAHATDADVSSTVSYALAAGGDNNLFDINSTTGAVTFKVSPDFENPQDAGHN